MIALERDVANIGFGEIRHSGELALGDAVGEIFTAQDVLEVFDAIDLVHALFRS